MWLTRVFFRFLEIEQNDESCKLFLDIITTLKQFLLYLVKIVSYAIRPKQIIIPNIYPPSTFGSWNFFKAFFELAFSPRDTTVILKCSMLSHLSDVWAKDVFVRNCIVLYPCLRSVYYAIFALTFDICHVLLLQSSRLAIAHVHRFFVQSLLVGIFKRATYRKIIAKILSPNGPQNARIVILFSRLTFDLCFIILLRRFGG